jgi:hypothetical protein
MSRRKLWIIVGVVSVLGAGVVTGVVGMQAALGAAEEAVGPRVPAFLTQLMLAGGCSAGPRDPVLIPRALVEEMLAARPSTLAGPRQTSRAQRNPRMLIRSLGGKPPRRGARNRSGSRGLQEPPATIFSRPFVGALRSPRE